VTIISPFTLGSIVHLVTNNPRGGGWTGIVTAIVNESKVQIVWVQETKTNIIAIADLRPSRLVAEEPSIREHFRKAGVWPAVEAVASGKRKKGQEGELWKN
jgi:hypothetical protein